MSVPFKLYRHVYSPFGYGRLRPSSNELDTMAKGCRQSETRRCEQNAPLFSPICERLGVDFPLFGFSHGRDVVAAVSKAGGIGGVGSSRFLAGNPAFMEDFVEATERLQTFVSE